MERIATVVSIEVYEGFHDAAWALIYDLSRMEKDIKRGQKRFRLQAFWEFVVPAMIGIGTLLIALANTFLN